MGAESVFARVDLVQEAPHGAVHVVIFVGESPVSLGASRTKELRGTWVVTNHGPSVVLIGSDPRVSVLTHLRLRRDESITVSLVTTLYAMAEASGSAG